MTGFRGSRGRRRGAAQGLFMQPGEKDQLEFGYCFDVSLRFWEFSFPFLREIPDVVADANANANAIA